jgi:dTDP-4-dehydrorhamnose 3,5-epimerase
MMAVQDFGPDSVTRLVRGDAGSILFEPLPLVGSYRLRLNPSVDERGFFARRFCAGEFARLGLETDFVQRSISYNGSRGTLRGLHFQARPLMETKIIRCTRGAAFDVIVDLRSGSPTYGRWHGEEISADNRLMLYVSCGFAHGFQTLMDDTEIDYEITPAYVPKAARGVRFDDPQIGIKWPLLEPIISRSDLNFPLLSAVEPL